MNKPFLTLAPMRGITTMHYRKAFVRRFGGLDAIMAPFITTVSADRINPKLLKDVLPENNPGLPLIPQLLGKDAAEFIRMSRALHDLGYEEINWNLGCPHKPVRNKGRGAGLLPHPETVDALLERICAESPVKISVKVRLGINDPSDLMKLIPVLNRHPLSEVIIHPRTAEQMYDGAVDLDAFAEAYAQINHPVCYNGDIHSLDVFQTLEAYCIGTHKRPVARQDAPPLRREALCPDAVGFQPLERFMLGRGLLANPFLCEIIKSGNPDIENAVERLRDFHDDVFENYRTVIDGDLPMLGKMKEFWSYPAQHLSNGRKFFKKISKCHRQKTYQEIVNEFMADAEWTA
ncbi:MAG TPA: tRNA-dihydrouridine synthase family protein [Tichowtungia sp.]|nr:tRNA-dihydrouridine synthase family protein [Tichowtungia sp.]